MRSSRILMFSGVRAGKAESDTSSSDVLKAPPKNLKVFFTTLQNGRIFVSKLVEGLHLVY